MREGNAERGFTLLEVMAVVVIIAILAAVVIPNFMQSSTRGKAKSEVSAVFAELGNREDAYKQESPTSLYLAAAACPAAASTNGTNVVTTPCTDWVSLAVEPPMSTLTCSYVVHAGPRTTSPLTELPTWVTGVTAPATSWYFIHATCPATEYFVASWDSKLRSKDGK